MGSNSFGHNYTRPQSKPSDDEIEDPLEIMLNKTGCKELHFQLQDCMAEHRDWRACQQLVSQFRDCMKEYEKNKKTRKTN